MNLQAVREANAKVNAASFASEAAGRAAFAAKGTSDFARLYEIYSNAYDEYVAAIAAVKAAEEGDDK